jgi:16S rRNA (cytosine1407-C5)-methyltransferase
MESFARSKSTVFRVNPLKNSAEELQSELEKSGFTPIPLTWLPGAFVIPDEQRRSLTSSDAFYKGRLYIQNPSSMLAPLMLSPRPGETVLDLAAAPGGKTLMMAGMMKNRGRISAVEPVRDRFYRLRRNIEKSGATIIHTYMKDGRGVGTLCPLMFDRVLLDAPCSSEAKFSTLNPESFSYWSLRKIRESRKLQKRLILSAWASLKPGGTLLYSTCSFAPEENESVVDFLLRKKEDAMMIPISLPLENYTEGIRSWEKRDFLPDLAFSRRIIPTSEMDGFFLALLRKKQ